MSTYFEFCEEKFQEIKERLNIKDKNSSGINYLAQISTERDDPEPKYWFQLTEVGHLLKPLTWCNKSEEKIHELIEKFVSELNFDAVEISYLETMSEHAQIVADQYKKMAEDNRHRLALEGPTKLSDVRKGKKVIKNAKN